MATWEQLSPTLQTLVQAHFPIIYGIVLPAGTESERRGFDIPGEVGIPGGASGEMIRHILVPDDFVETTKQHLREHGAPDTIAVHPFSCFRPDDRIS